MTDSHDIEAVEKLFYAQLVPDKPQIKIAMLLVRAFDEELPPDGTINMALDKLILRHDIQSFGLIHDWRHSEIKRHSKIAF
ncbi:MAG: hypothetical protein ACU0BJ_04330 [Shimia sp.]|uniref:hypothetical protein n=1 Tax=Shimia sp. TaxID=1954381 RepID=UPI00405826EF